MKNKLDSLFFTKKFVPKRHKFYFYTEQKQLHSFLLVSPPLRFRMEDV